MGQLAQVNPGPAHVESLVQFSARRSGSAWTVKSSVQYLLEAVLIVGMQIIFRASLFLRRRNY